MRDRERGREIVKYPFRSTSTIILEEMNPQLREKCQNKGNWKVVAY